MKTKLEIINETAEYYGTDPNRRAYDERKCRYRMEKEDGQRYCAFGRCMQPWALDEVKKKGVESKGIGEMMDELSIEVVDQILKPEYHNHDLNFWYDLQLLHDRDSFYTPTSLSARGKDYVITLIARWGRL